MYLNGALINNNDLPDTLATFFDEEVANVGASVQVYDMVYQAMNALP